MSHRSVSTSGKVPAVGVPPPARSGAYIFVEDDLHEPIGSTVIVSGDAKASTAVPAVEVGGSLPDRKSPPVIRVPPSRMDLFPGMETIRSSMKKEMQFVLGASYQVSTTAAGKGPATAVTNDQLAALTEFVSLATLFDEFFIKRCHVTYQPASRYEKTQVSTTYIDFPLHVASIQHGSALFPSHTEATNCAHLLICNSADPWKFTWSNTENKRSGVLPDPSTSTVTPTQGWCLTAAPNAALYTGAVQIISPSAYGAAASFLLGTVTVRWEVAFRCRS